MRKHFISVFLLMFGTAAAFGGAAEENNSYEKTGKYVSEWGTRYYAQGGVVVDGTAYFTASSKDYTLDGDPPKDEGFPFVVAFEVKTLRKIRTYPFEDTYDSTPLVIPNGKGRWLVIAHEWKKERTTARNRDTGEIVWTSEANQPVKLFFGYSYYRKSDGSLIIFTACKNGLHGISSEGGREVWHVKRKSKGGVTPAVDQKEGVVYYQCDGEVLKIKADDGRVLKEAAVEKPVDCMSWNTVLVNDNHGYYVATYWYDAENPYFNSAVRVYDQDLKLIWEKTGLPIGKKSTLTYVDGKLITGCGDSWSKQYQGKEKNAGADWKYIPAYSVQTGEVVWKCDLSGYSLACVMNVPYLNGSIYAECSPAEKETSKIFKINAANGNLEEVFDYGCRVHSCAGPIISGGRMYSGSLGQDRIVVTELGSGSEYEWRGPFGDPQTHTNAVPDAAGVTAIPMREVSPETSSAETIKIGDRRTKLYSFQFLK